MIRDWAAIEGGAKVGKFTPPDYSDFGCGPSGVLDLNLGSGWGSDAVKSTYGSNTKGPRSVIVKLPETINVTTFGLASYGACGDGPEAGVKRFMIETSSSGHNWVTAFVGNAPSNGRLISYKPTAGKKNVRYVRLTMLSNHGDNLFMDVMELTVHGK